MSDCPKCSKTLIKSDHCKLCGWKKGELVRTTGPPPASLADEVLRLLLRKNPHANLYANGVAEATYAAFLGHDPSVSRKHYVSPTAAEYDALTLAR